MARSEYNHARGVCPRARDGRRGSQMHLAQLGVSASSVIPGFVRTTAVIALDRCPQPLTYWIEFPEEHRDDISETADPWVTLMLPIAVMRGEAIQLDLPVDPLLLENLIGLQRIWKSWYPDLHHVGIDAPKRSPLARSADQQIRRKRSAGFFSGGIDSLFTLSRHNDVALGQGTRAVDDLLCIAGFNTPPGSIDGMRRHLGPIAERFRKHLFPIVTNIRYSTQPIETPYSNPLRMIYLAHGAVLATMAHLFGPRFDEIVIPGSDDYTNLEPYGSHPITDPLFSSRNLRLIQDGASFTRVERTAAVAASNTPLDGLHVCWQDWELGNCSRCTKCLYTMATLDVLGAAHRATSFDWSLYDCKTLGAMWIPGRTERIEFSRLIDEANRRNRPDIAATVLRSIDSSRRRERLLQLVNSNPVSRRFWFSLRKLRLRRIVSAGSLGGSVSAPRDL